MKSMTAECRPIKRPLVDKSFEQYVQRSKEDWWLCKCGSYHKCFPYECELNEYKRKVKLALIKHLVIEPELIDEVVGYDGSAKQFVKGVGTIKHADEFLKDLGFENGING